MTLLTRAAHLVVLKVLIQHLTEGQDECTVILMFSAKCIINYLSFMGHVGEWIEMILDDHLRPVLL